MMNPSPLALAADRYRRALPASRLFSFPLTALDRLGVPVHALSLFAAPGVGLAWPVCEGVGYGETTLQAEVGAFGELTEEVSSARALAGMPRVVGSFRELLARHGPEGVVDPVTLCLEAGSPYAPDLVLEWTEVRRWPTGETVLLPVEFVACAGMDVPPRVGVSRLATPITNGHGAGTTREMAVAHGLLELLQRDGNSVRYRALAGGTAVDPATVDDPAARALLDRYDAAGVDVVIKVAATDFGMTNLYVVGADRDPGSGGLPVMTAACGEAVHPVREVALRKALLEFASSRARLALFHGPLDLVEAHTPAGYLEAYQTVVDPAGEENRGLGGMARWLRLDLGGMRRMLDRVLRVERLVPFVGLRTTDDPVLAGADGGDKLALLREVARRLTTAGFDLLVADLAAPGSDGHGIHAVKVIVPGLEVETISYRRIGERNVRRLLKNQREPGGQTLAGIGEPPAGALPVLLPTAAEARLGGPAWLDPTALERALGDLYVLYREPGRHAARLSAEPAA